VVVRAALPWLSVLIGFLIVITYIPEVSLWPPNLLLGKPA
jgi:C4-dicarboxylate transporter DctM subunit